MGMGRYSQLERRMGEAVSQNKERIKIIAAYFSMKMMNMFLSFEKDG